MYKSQCEFVGSIPRPGGGLKAPHCRVAVPELVVSPCVFQSISYLSNHASWSSHPALHRPALWIWLHFLSKQFTPVLAFVSRAAQTITPGLHNWENETCCWGIRWVHGMVKLCLKKHWAFSSKCSSEHLMLTAWYLDICEFSSEFRQEVANSDIHRAWQIT